MVTAINTYSYDATEVKNQVCITKEEAEEKFYKLCKSYLDSERERYIEEYLLNNEISYSEIRDIAKENEEFIDYGYEYSDNEQCFSIRKDYDDGDSQEEFIIRMYFCKFGEELQSQFFSFNDNSEDVDKFFIKLNKLFN